jgi:hypothetical protein
MAMAICAVCATAHAYDLETLIEAKYRNVEVTLKDGTQFSGYAWDVIKVVEDDSNSAKVVKYSVTSQDFSKVKVSGEELTSNTRTKYYIIIRKGVVEYRLDSDDIALLGIQKW